MTIKQTLAAIKGTGARGRWIADVGEFRVNLPNGTESTAYYTCDSEDAIYTARAMMREVATV